MPTSTWCNKTRTELTSTICHYESLKSVRIHTKSFSNGNVETGTQYSQCKCNCLFCYKQPYSYQQLFALCNFTAKSIQCVIINVNAYGLDNQGLIPSRTPNNSPHHSVQNGPVTYPVSNPVGIRDCFLRVKYKFVMLTIHFHLVQRSRTYGKFTFASLHTFMCDIQVKLYFTLK